jgi:tRNA(Ile)-lysidine synthase TilS/MesJ
MRVISLTEIQETIKNNCREDYFTLLLRRFMMRLAEMTAKTLGAGAIITGESLGQVASQTMNALGVTNNAVGELPVFRPLIAMDKEEIVQIARKIGTFDISIQPFEDCCTVFTPRHPVTNPILEKVLKEEAKRMKEKADREEKSLQRLEDYMMSMLKRSGEKKLSAGTFTVGTRTSTSVYVAPDFNDERFIRTTTTSIPDKVALKEALKNGEAIDGASLVEKENLSIK